MTMLKLLIKLLILTISSNNLILHLRVLLTLAFKMLYDNSRKMGNHVRFAPRPLHQGKKSSTNGCCCKFKRKKKIGHQRLQRFLFLCGQFILLQTTERRKKNDPYKKCTCSTKLT